MTLYDLKPRFQNLLRPVCRALAGWGFTPNQITWAALILSVASGGWVLAAPEAAGPRLWLPVALLLRMALNAIDGLLAREHDLKTPAGALLNEIGDVLSDLVLYLPFAALTGYPPLLVGAVVALAGLTELAGMAALQIGAPRNFQGPMGKSDRAFIFGLLAFLGGIGVSPGPWIPIVLSAMCGLMLLTVWNRARTALREKAS